MFNLKAILISSMVSVCPTCHRDRCSTIFGWILGTASQSDLIVHKQYKLAEVYFPIVVHLHFCHYCVHLQTIGSLKYWMMLNVDKPQSQLGCTQGFSATGGSLSSQGRRCFSKTAGWNYLACCQYFGDGGTRLTCRYTAPNFRKLFHLG